MQAPLRYGVIVRRPSRSREDVPAERVQSPGVGTHRQAEASVQQGAEVARVGGAIA
jgi:hypothetical protein